MTNKRNTRQTVRQLGHTAMFGLVRGIATAAGSAVIAGIAWWLQGR
ncbi:hypothetical protein OG883_13780 [Streptomyces sp. NBC_01142]|nr:hypothetical protein [Streptomyces sp. NBC_01142]MCX4820961.1 hypothetical protein [Streptomyces sp. NBC_01142]